MTEFFKKIKLNPILNKELRLGSRSIRLPLSVMFYDAFLAVVAVFIIFIIFMSNSEGSTDFSGYLAIYQAIGWMQLSIMLVIVPILTAGTISGEREKQTLEIMLTTPQKPMAIIWGKLLSSLANFMVFLVSSIPVMALAFVLGGLNWFALLGYLAMMTVVGIYVGSIGIFCSAAFKKTIISIVMTFLIMIGLLVVSVGIFFGIILVAAIVYESMNYTANYTLPNPNFSILPLILIGNPLTGFLDYMLISMNLMSISEILEDADIFGTLMPMLAHAWIPLNIVACGGISYFFLRMAANKLDPIRKQNKKKKKKVVPVVVAQSEIDPVMQGSPAPQQVPPMAQQVSSEPQQVPVQNTIPLEQNPPVQEQNPISQAQEPPVDPQNPITEKLTSQPPQ